MDQTDLYGCLKTVRLPCWWCGWPLQLDCVRLPSVRPRPLGYFPPSSVSPCKWSRLLQIAENAGEETGTSPWSSLDCVSARMKRRSSKALKQENKLRWGIVCLFGVSPFCNTSSECASAVVFLTLNERRASRDFLSRFSDLEPTLFSEERTVEAEELNLFKLTLCIHISGDILSHGTHHAMVLKKFKGTRLCNRLLPVVFLILWDKTETCSANNQTCHCLMYQSYRGDWACSAIRELKQLSYVLNT